MHSDQTIKILQWLIDRGEPATTSEIAAKFQVDPIVVRVTLASNRNLFVPHRQTKGVRCRCGVPRAEMRWVAWEE